MGGPSSTIRLSWASVSVSAAGPCALRVQQLQADAEGLSVAFEPGNLYRASILGGHCAFHYTWPPTECVGKQRSTAHNDPSMVLCPTFK